MTIILNTSKSFLSGRFSNDYFTYFIYSISTVILWSSSMNPLVQIRKLVHMESVCGHTSRLTPEPAPAFYSRENSILTEGYLNN